ncbi:MAG: hypothetical protein Q6358_05725 [Candidatus Brocadiales bacterium]|nr:hypothetical protein [Candidatus Brocadiales bacterium]
MLISIQFPIADSRGFVENTGRLRKPLWPLPTPDKEFVRTYGAIRTRPGGGLDGWLGENEICEASRSIRLSSCITVNNAGSQSPIPLRVAFRRYFFDGLAAGKFELGLATKSRNAVILDKRDIKTFMEKFIGLKVRIRNPNGGHVECSMLSAGKHLAHSYLYATTQIGHREKTETWWVRDGSPLLFLECCSHDQVPVPYVARKVNLPDLYNFELHHCLVPFQGGTVRMWFLSKYDNEDSSAARRLRIYLHRLHAEHECLRLILRNAMAKSLNVVPRSHVSDILQQYFNEATKRIGLLEAKSSDQFHDEICELARESMNLLNPGQLDALKRVLESFDLRPNISRKVADYVRKEGNVSNFTLIENEEIYMKEVSKDNIHIGHVVGPVNVKSRLDHVTQIVKNAPAVADAKRQELSALIEELKQALEYASSAEPEDTQRVVQAAEMVAAEVSKEKPNKSFLSITTEGLKEAARAVEAIAPSVLRVAMKIAAFVAGVF